MIAVGANAMPLVSVIMPTYRREGTLRRAIKSVLGQTYKNLELIVIGVFARSQIDAIALELER